MPRLKNEAVEKAIQLLTNDPLNGVVVKESNADIVEVVRCKDCKWGTPHSEGDEYTKCFKLCTTFFSGHYCAWGERREDE